MTLIERPPPPPVRPELAVPKTPAITCGCEANDPDMVRLRALMAKGMSQVDASRVLWSPTVPPSQSLAVRDPGRWARRFVRAALAAALPWLKLPTPTEVS